MVIGGLYVTYETGVV